MNGITTLGGCFMVLPNDKHATSRMIEEIGFSIDQTMQQATSLIISKIKKLLIVIFIIRVKIIE
jgi:hypothetical protein